MTTLAFDTYAQVKQLVRAGVAEAQAEAIINAVAGATALPDVSQLATKSDLAALAGELRSDLEKQSLAHKSDIALLASELRGEINAVRGEIKGLKGELIWWILGAVGSTAALPQILAHLPK